jgi:hypothetical protein
LFLCSDLASAITGPNTSWTARAPPPAAPSPTLCHSWTLAMPAWWSHHCWRPTRSVWADLEAKSSFDPRTSVSAALRKAVNIRGHRRHPVLA